MTRKKVKLTWIVNDSARRASLRKRRAGLLKKVSELTILCGVKAFVIIYSPDDPEPAVWPSRPEVLQLLTRFQNMTDMERYKKMVNQETYLKERMGKLNEQSRKHRKNSRELEMAGLMQQVHRDKGFNGLDHTQLCGLTWLVKEKRKEIRKRIGYLEQIPSLQLGTQFPLGPFPFNYQDLDKDDGGDDDGTGGQARGEPRDGRRNSTDGGVSWDQWFTNKINNPEDNVAGGSRVRNDLGLPYPFSFTGGGGDDIGFHPGHNGVDDSLIDVFRVGLPHTRNMEGIRGGYNFYLGQLPRENESLRGSCSAGGNNFDLGLLLGSDMAGGNTAGNSFDPWLPHDLGFNPGGNNSVELNFDMGLHQGNSTGGNSFDLCLPHGNNMGGDSAVVNHVDPWLACGDMGGENLGLGLLPGSNFAGSSTVGNPFHRHDDSGDGSGNVSGSNSGLPGSFGAGSSDHIEQPFDVTKSWPSNNFNP